MPITTVKGDIRFTKAQAILLGLNTRGQVEVSSLETTLRDQQPVFFSEYRRLAHSGKLTGGNIWIFRDTTPWLLAAIVRDSPSAATKLRYVEAVVMSLRRDWQREMLKSLAIAPMGTPEEWYSIRAVLHEHLNTMPIPIILYTEHIKDQKAEE